jgi:triacylglycerol lipase
MNIKTAKICAELSKVVYQWDLWDFYLKDNYDNYLERKVSLLNHEIGFFYNEGNLFIAIRGTELDSLEDIKTDLDVTCTRFPELCGREVHSGFHGACNLIWKHTLENLFNLGTRLTSFGPVNKVILTGHSMGGAVATLLAVKLQYWNEIGIELYTFGSPQVLTEEASEMFNKDSVSNINHYRFVNNNDVVPKLPINSFKWEHCGELYYINRKKKIFMPKTYGFWNRLWDGILGRIRGIGDLKPDGFADHSIQKYSEVLKKY